MDILTHALSGALAATGVAACSRKRPRHKAGIVCSGTVGALLPDVDTITLWSAFDTTIGAFLDLPVSGRTIYFGNHAYSHHNFTHSLAAGLMITVLVGLVIFVRGVAWPKRQGRPAPLKDGLGVLIALFAGYVMHLMGDLPTPGHSWSGIKLLWPLDRPVGGSGLIWWWNNYDIFLILFLGCLASLFLVFCGQKLHKKAAGHAIVLIVAGSMSLAVFQVTHRPVRFGGTATTASHAENERRSLEVQHVILGDHLFDIMVSLDHRLNIYF